MRRRGGRAREASGRLRRRRVQPLVTGQSRARSSTTRHGWQSSDDGLVGARAFMKAMCGCGALKVLAARWSLRAPLSLLRSAWASRLSGLVRMGGVRGLLAAAFLAFRQKGRGSAESASGRFASRTKIVRFSSETAQAHGVETVQALCLIDITQRAGRAARVGAVLDGQSRHSPFAIIVLPPPRPSSRSCIELPSGVPRGWNACCNSPRRELAGVVSGRPTA